MRTTERNHWLNGHTVHGGRFHQYAFTVGRYGFIVAIGRPYFTAYRLI